jgi:hypothetical protein
MAMVARQEGLSGAIGCDDSTKSNNDSQVFPVIIQLCEMFSHAPCKIMVAQQLTRERTARMCVQILRTVLEQ